MKLPNIFLPEKDLEGKIEGLLKDTTQQETFKQKYSDLKTISAGTYAEGIAKLKEQGRKPFTFYENVEARIADYEVNGEGAELFKTWLDSVTGVVYKANSTKFKLVLRCSRLENIKSDFNKSFIPIDYDSEQGIELDRKKGKYNKPLTREEVKNHEFWLTVMKGDKEKLAKYVDVWFDKTKAKKGMSVCLRGNTEQDELRGLALDGDLDGSVAYGDLDLDNDACFVSGAQ